MPSMDDVYGYGAPGSNPGRSRAVSDLGAPGPDRRACDRCHEVKVLTDFPATREGWSKWCKACWREQAATEAAARPVIEQPPVVFQEGPFVADAADTSWVDGIQPGPLAKLTDNPNADALVLDLARVADRLLPAVLQSDEERVGIVNMLLEGKRAETSLETLRKKLVEPLKGKAKAIDDAMGPSSPTRRAFAELRRRGEALIGAYNAHAEAQRARERDEAERRQREAVEAEARAVAEAQAAGTEQERHQALARADVASLEQSAATVEAADVALPVRGVRTDAGSVSFTERWTFKVENANDVPRGYLIVDEQEIRRAVALGIRNIPGVHIYPEQGLSVRAR